MARLDLGYNYRVAFALSVLRFLIPPQFCAYAVVRFVLYPRWAPSPTDDGLLASLLYRFMVFMTYILAVPVYWTIKVQYERWALRRAAARRGAVLVPEVPAKWIGNIDIMVGMIKGAPSSYVTQQLDQWFNQLGSDTINIRFLWQDNLMTRDHRIMQIILATGFENWEKGPEGCLRMFGMFGHGIFNTNREEWKAHRMLTRPFFARERVTDFDNFGHYTDKVMDHIRNSCVLHNESIDIQDLFGRFTLDSAGQFLFGTASLNTLDLPLPPPKKQARLGPKGSAPEGDYGGFVLAFEELQTVIPKRANNGALWPAFELTKDVGAEHNRVIDEWVAPLVSAALEEKKKRGARCMKAEEGCLTDHLCDSTSDPKLIRDELMNVLLASRDTTAALLSFTVYLLSMHPDVADKLRDEVLRVVPEGAPTYNDIKKLKFLRAVLNETLRLFPPVPLNERSSIRPCTVPSNRPDGKPYYVPGPETQMRYSVLLMHRRKDLWGEDALEFNPERWCEPDRVKALTRDPFRFLPFNAGPRICLGQNFAYNEASFMMVRLMQEYERFELTQAVDAPEGSVPNEEVQGMWAKLGGRYAKEAVWPKSALTMFAKGGVWVKMHAASN